MPSDTKNDQSSLKYEERRRYCRELDADLQLHFVVNGHELVTVNWSTGGCLVKTFDHWKAGDTNVGTLESHDGTPQGRCYL